ncbi:predicted protein [Nematostella vectensis]|uniref:G-protein coupled receptors family 1 profile domain-containing protein n=1 Tax=Nematostella vectensis TaxID=45351 RepID=A7SF59_NEMVE|nr:5-hydroxytryptamine receptor 1F [Nematostella vectensis]EDO37629.1 predicted protein [Nematostella vectensis]|eukprot:XP_001629692.1 predicted protein [Nematostella vectensis]
MQRLQMCPPYLQGNVTEVLQSLHDPNIVLATLNSILSVPTAFINALVIAAILTTPRLRTPSFYLLTNLAVSDCLVGLIAQPALVAFRVAEVNENRELSCKLSNLSIALIACLSVTSLITITAISLDRYFALKSNIKYRTTVTVKRVLISITFIWIFSIIFGVYFTLFGNVKSFSIATGSFGSICLFLISVSYFRTYRMLQHHTNNQIQSHESETASNKAYRREIRRYRKTLNLMVWIVSLLFICCTPYIVMSAVVMVFGYDVSHVVTAAFIASVTAVLFNSFINPLLYLLKIRQIRKACYRLIGLK